MTGGRVRANEYGGENLAAVLRGCGLRGDRRNIRGDHRTGGAQAG